MNEELPKKKKKVVICIPTITKPFQQCLDAIEASVPLLDAAGWDHYTAWSIGCPYISHARSQMVRKALDALADVIVFIDHDISWRPEDLLKLIETEGDYVSGAYRFKDDNEESYMGALLPDIHGIPQVRADGCVKAYSTPAGFLKMTRYGISKFMLHYPELNYIDNSTLCPDLFNHGAYKGVWYGEDYALSRNWLNMGGEIWVIPDMNIDHYNAEGRCWKGNYHQYLLRQPGGSEWKGNEAC
jgi:glycosyltransferase involved in cell wall biosynthesis